MTDTAFDTAQALYDAAFDHADDELPDPSPAAEQLSPMVSILAEYGMLDDDGDDVRSLSDWQATVTIRVDGHEYSLMLNRKD